MPSAFDHLKVSLREKPEKWLVTGAAGFIGSHIVECLLGLDQQVRGLDNFSTGHRHNLEDVRSRVTPEQWARFEFTPGDLIQPADCHRACASVDYVLHEAALGSVSRSLVDPQRSHINNVDGFINLLVAARDAKATRFVYASSSSVYGDHPVLPKVEHHIGRPLSPYAATKLVNEIYADVFQRCYGLPSTGLRYFNVFGPRQDTNGTYAAVIPRWFASAARGESAVIYGDGETSRDFCYVANVVQANLLAATSDLLPVPGRIYNVAAGRRTTLNELWVKVRDRVARVRPAVATLVPQYQAERAGDVRHSLADISLAQTELGYTPTHDVDGGLDEAAAWFLKAMPSSSV